MQAYQKLAEQLPYAKHVHSKLLCHVTKELMDEDNVPMVMPNGTVYSQRAVRRLSSDSGMFTCPKSGAHHGVLARGVAHQAVGALLTWSQLPIR